MKSLEQIKHARVVVADNATRTDISMDQRMLLSGMLVALQWVSDQGGTTLEILLNGTPLAIGRTQQEVIEASKSAMVLAAIELCKTFFDQFVSKDEDYNRAKKAVDMAIDALAEKLG